MTHWDPLPKITLKRRWPLYVVAAFFGACDAICTMWSQPQSYWAGAFSSNSEGSPFWRIFIGSHPAAFFLVCAFYIALVGVLIFKLPARWAVVTMMTVTIWHAFGASTWIFTDDFTYWILVGGGIAMSLFILWSFKKAGMKLS